MSHERHYLRTVTGIDFKITPDDQVAIIEINGIKSGWEGIRSLNSLSEHCRATALIWLEKHLCEEGRLSDFDLDGAIRAANEGKMPLQIDLGFIFSDANPHKNKMDARVEEIYEQWIRKMIAEGREEEIKDMRTLDWTFLWRFAFHPNTGVILVVSNYKNKLVREFVNYFWENEPALPETANVLLAQNIPYLVSKLDAQESSTDAVQFQFHPKIKPIYATPLERNDSLDITQLNFRYDQFADDKLKQKEIIPVENLAPYTVWNGDTNAVHAFVRSLHETPHPLTSPQTHPYVVVKELRSAHGFGVKVFALTPMGTASAEMIEHVKKYPAGELLIEGFVPSKPYKPWKDDARVHDGCGRMVIDHFLDKRNGEQLTIFRDAYIRLSPEPIQPGKFDEFALKANLTGSKPAMAMRETDQTVFDRVYEIGLEIMKRQRAIINDI